MARLTWKDDLAEIVSLLKHREISPDDAVRRISLAVPGLSEKMADLEIYRAQERFLKDLERAIMVTNFGENWSVRRDKSGIHELYRRLYEPKSRQQLADFFDTYARIAGEDEVISTDEFDFDQICSSPEWNAARTQFEAEWESDLGWVFDTLKPQPGTLPSV